MRTPRLALAAALALAFGCQLGPLRAEPATPFDKMISGLGYEITPETETTTGFFNAGDYPINYSFSSDKTVVVLSISYSVDPGQSSKLPAIAMLKANAELTSAFQVKEAGGKPSNVLLSRYFLLAGLTPVGLRQQVDALISNANEYKSLLDPTNWK